MIVILSRHIHHAQLLEPRSWRWPQLDLDARVDMIAAARLAGVPVGTVKNWRYRGWLDDRGRRHTLDPDEAGKVRLGDVLRAERETRRSARSHRRLPPPGAYHRVA